MVSVITPAYNAAGFIGQTLASVRAQTIPDWEMVVVDDCSQDETATLVRSAAMGDSRIQLVQASRNGGAAASRNLGMEKARGRFIAFLDADDLWDPPKLERQLQFHQRTGAAFSFTAYRVMTPEGAKLGSVPVAQQRLRYRDMLRGRRVGCLTVMLDRERVPGAIRFPGEEGWEDFALWLDLLRRGVVAEGIPEELASYRVIPGSASRNKLRAAWLAWCVYRRQPMSPLAALWWFAHYVVDGARKHIGSGAYRVPTR